MSRWPHFRTVLRVLPLLVVGLCAAATPAHERALVPDAAAQAKAQELFREVYGKEYDAATSDAKKAELARKLLDQAAKDTADPAAHFVLLRIAKSIAVLAGDVETAVEAVDRLVSTYDMDAVKVKLECLRAVAREAKSSSEHGAIARQALATLDLATTEDDFDSARELGEIARDSARKARDYALLKQIVNRLTLVEQAEAEFDEYQEALAVLEDSPTDPRANLSAGRYLCLTKGDWEGGVPMLALGSDESLKTLASMELEETAAPEGWIALADGWWDHGAVCEGLEKNAFLRHAGELYEKALPDVSSSLLRTKLTKRLDEIAAMGSPDDPASGGEKEEVPDGPALGVDLEHQVSQVSTVDHVLQLWMVHPDYSGPGRYRLSIRHAVAGQEGAFYMTVWTDLNGDGFPDTEIARSPKMVAAEDGQWSTWRFLSKVARIYVGDFTEGKGTKLYYATRTPAGYQGLSSTVFVSRSHRSPPSDKAAPRCTNIRVQKIKE